MSLKMFYNSDIVPSLVELTKNVKTMDPQAFEKFPNSVFSRYSNFLSMSDLKWSKTTPVFFVSKYLNKYGL